MSLIKTAFFLVSSWLLCCFQVYAAVNIDGVLYSFTGAEATVTGCGDKTAEVLRIPATVEYNGKVYNVVKIGKNAFVNCRNYRKLIIEDSPLPINGWYHSDYELNRPFLGCCFKEIYVGRDILTKVAGGGFGIDYVQLDSDAPEVEMVLAGEMTYIPVGDRRPVEGYGGHCFCAWPNLTNVTLGGKIDYIGKAAFCWNQALRKVTFLPGEGEIEFYDNNAFSNCPVDTVIAGRTGVKNMYTGGLTTPSTVIIPKETAILSGSLLGNCKEIKSLIIEDAADTVQIDSPIGNGCKLDFCYIGRPCKGNWKWTSGATSINKLTIGGLIRSITENPFFYYSNVNTLYICAGVEEIDDNVFQHYTGLTSLSLPSSIRKVGASAFRYCKNIKSLELAEGLDTIGEYAFDYLAMDSVAIPSTVRYVGTNAFGHMANLKYFDILPSESDLTLNGKIISKATKSMPLTVKLGRILNPGTLKAEDADTLCFHANITVVPEGLMEANSTVKGVILHDRMTAIGDKAFDRCTNITKIVTENPIPPVIGTNAFSAKAYSGAHVTVPRGSKYAYSTNAGWKNFNAIISPGPGFNVCVETNEGGAVLLDDEDKPNAVVADGEPINIKIIPEENQKVEAYEINGLDHSEFLSNPEEGVYSHFIPWVGEDKAINVTFASLTGITNVTENQEWNIYGDVLVIGAQVSEVLSLYDLTGKCIYRGISRTVPLPAKGVYILRIGHKSIKFHI